MKKYIFFILLFYVKQQLFSQKKKPISIQIINLDSNNLKIDSNTTFEITVKNNKRKKILIPSKEYENQYFMSDYSFFKVFVYRNEKEKIDTFGLQKEKLLIHSIPYTLYNSFQTHLIKSLVYLKTGNALKYQLKLLRGFVFEKGHYYYRLQFITPRYVEDLKKVYYDEHYLKYDFDIF